MKFRSVIKTACTLVLVTAFSYGTAHATEITFSFEGFVQSTNKPGFFPLGQSVSGRYTFDSTTPDANPFNPEQGAYLPVQDFGFPPEPPEKGVRSFSFESGAYQAVAQAPDLVNGGGDILVNRDSFISQHTYLVFLQRGMFNALWGPDIGGEELVRMWLNLTDQIRTAITTIDLPLTPPDLLDFTSATFNLFFDFDSTGLPGGVVFQLTSLDLVADQVPAPGAALILLAGTMILLWRRRSAAAAGRQAALRPALL